MAQLIVAQGLVLRVHVASTVAIVEMVGVISGIILKSIGVLTLFLSVASVPVTNHGDVSLQTRNAWIVLGLGCVFQCEQPLLWN